MTFIQTRQEDILLKTNALQSHEAPRLEKVVLNIGLGEGSKKEIAFIHLFFLALTGYKASSTYSSKAVLEMGIRRGALRGSKMTLRKKRALSFLEKLNMIYLPNEVAFKGISNSGKTGRHIHLQIKKPGALPEVQGTFVFGNLPPLDIAICMQSGDPSLFLSSLGFPFICSP